MKNFESFIQSREREAQRPGEARRERGRSQRRKPKRVVHVAFGKAKGCRRSVWKSKELTLPALSLPMHPARKLHRYTIHTTSDGTARIPCTIVYPCEFRWNWLQVPMCVIILSGIRHPPPTFSKRYGGIERAVLTDTNLFRYRSEHNI